MTRSETRKAMAGLPLPAVLQPVVVDGDGHGATRAVEEPADGQVTKARRTVLIRLSRLRRTRLGRMWHHGTDIELMQRSLSFAALGFTTLVPLLIVVAAATALRGDADFPGISGSGGCSPRPRRRSGRRKRALRGAAALPGAP